MAQNHTVPSSIDLVFRSALRCQRCYPGREIYVPLPDPNNSTGKSEIMFINERPGRIGTGKSGFVSFDNDDPTANFFSQCFEAAGLDRKSVFVTNACLCHLRFDEYTDTAPTITEMTNCHHWLREQLKIVRPFLIVTVGWSALRSMLRYEGLWLTKDRKTFGSWVGRPIKSTSPWIYPVAHTSLRGRANRKAALQIADWLEIPHILEQASRSHH